MNDSKESQRSSKTPFALIALALLLFLFNQYVLNADYKGAHLFSCDIRIGYLWGEITSQNSTWFFLLQRFFILLENQLGAALIFSSVLILSISALLLVIFRKRIYLNAALLALNCWILFYGLRSLFVILYDTSCWPS